jgi:HEAT repeat protein
MADDTTVAELIEGLKSGSAILRLRCAQDLGLYGTAAAVPALAAALKDEVCRVREYSAWALGQLGPEAVEAVPMLMEALKDEDAEVRTESAGALGRIGPAAEAAVPALLEALKDPDEGVRKSCASALDRIDPAAKDDRRR